MSRPTLGNGFGDGRLTRLAIDPQQAPQQAPQQVEDV